MALENLIKIMLEDEILDLRRSAKGKGTMYIIIPDGQESFNVQSVHVATPKVIFNKDELDGFIKFFLENSIFTGRLAKGKEHPIWKTLVTESSTREYYKFSLSDSWIEICPVPLDDILYGKTSV